jgi:hypothetical protein
LKDVFVVGDVVDVGVAPPRVYAGCDDGIVRVLLGAGAIVRVLLLHLHLGAAEEKKRKPINNRHLYNYGAISWCEEGKNSPVPYL